MTAVNTITYTGDKVTKLVYDNTVYMSAAGITQDTMQENVDAIYDGYTKTKGMSYTYSFDGDVFHEVVTIDLKQASLKDLLALGVISADSDKVKSISLKLTLDGMEAGGYTCN